jgi:peptide/nickel transport system ATP-binding protein
VTDQLERIQSTATVASDGTLTADALRVVLRGPKPRPILRDVSLGLRPGEIRALVGEPGSGKTVTALAMIGLLPSAMLRVGGRVTLGQLDLTSLDEERWEQVRGRRIAMVFQDPLAALNPVLSIGTQLEEPMRAHLRLDGKSRTARALELLDQVGLPPTIRTLRMYPHELSGGMRQRALIAVALSCDPQVLLADEPTTALDVTVQARILELIRDIVAARGLSVLFVTHALAVAGQLADSISVMYAGTVVESGPSRAVLGNPTHPYTVALLKSAPRVDARTRPMPALPGSVEGIWDITRGCRFAPRCAHRMAQCETDDPVLEPAGGDHQVACWVMTPGANPQS